MHYFDDPGTAVAALKSNTTDLRGNRIGAAGAGALADALKSNTTLTSLDLYGNSIGDAGPRRWARALSLCIVFILYIRSRRQRRALRRRRADRERVERGAGDTCQPPTAASAAHGRMRPLSTLGDDSEALIVDSH